MLGSTLFTPNTDKTWVARLGFSAVAAFIALAQLF